MKQFLCYASSAFGLEGLIKKINLHKRNVTITFPFGGKAIEATVGIDIVDKID